MYSDAHALPLLLVVILVMVLGLLCKLVPSLIFITLLLSIGRSEECPPPCWFGCRIVSWGCSWFIDYDMKLTFEAHCTLVINGSLLTLYYYYLQLDFKN